MKTQRWILVIAVVIAVFLVIIYGFLPKPVSVDAAKASRGLFRVIVEEEGETRVKDRFVISAPVAGFMRRIPFDVGDPVKKGQTVAELEPLRSVVLDPRSRAEAEASVSAAESALRAAEENARAASASAEYAESTAGRTKKLFEESLASKDAMERVQAEQRRTKANLLSAEAAVKVAKSELEKARSVLRYSAAEGVADRSRTVAIRTPVNGRILRIHRKSEGVANPGEALLDVGDPGKLEVKAEVLSAEAVKISRGTPVLFERWGGDSALSGTVSVIEPSGFTKISSLGVEEQRVLVISEITSLPESWQKLGDGYRVEAQFVIWEGADVLQVPASALFRRGENWAAFIVKNGKAHLSKVTVGKSNGLKTEILSGIAEGDLVIMHPDDLIKDGTRVKIR